MFPIFCSRPVFVSFQRHGRESLIFQTEPVAGKAVIAKINGTLSVKHCQHAPPEVNLKTLAHVHLHNWEELVFPDPCFMRWEMGSRSPPLPQTCIHLHVQCRATGSEWSRIGDQHDVHGLQQQKISEEIQKFNLISDSSYSHNVLLGRFWREQGFSTRSCKIVMPYAQTIFLKKTWMSQERNVRSKMHACMTK